MDGQGRRTHWRHGQAAGHGQAECRRDAGLPGVAIQHQRCLAGPSKRLFEAARWESEGRSMSEHEYQESRYVKGQCAFCGDYKANHGKPTEMTSLVEIKRRLAAIEQGQGVICERLDGLVTFCQMAA